MAGIKISDLPPNTLPLVGDEKMELEDASGDSTQATVDDIIAAATGLDATFITVTANAALPNERVLAAGTNVSLVDTGPNGTLTINVPTFGDVFKVGTPVDNQVGVWTGDGTIEGDPDFTWNGTRLNIAGTGSPGSLLLSFGDGDTGFYQLADDILNMAFAGVGAWSFRSSVILSFNGPQIFNELPSATNPVFCPHFAESDTGVGWLTDQVVFIGGGVSQARSTAPASGGFEANNTLTGAGFERVLTVSDLGGFGDVFKVGTPVDNQVGVWTGDGTIEGDPNFTWDGASKTLNLGAGSSIFAGSSTYFFQNGNLSLDGESTIIPVLSIIQGGINNQAVSITPTAMVFNHDAGGLVFNISGNLARWEFETAVRITNSTGSDWIEQDHDGTNYNFSAFQTVDVNFTGLSGRIMQDAETLAFVSEIIVPDPLLLSSGGVAVPTYSFAVDTDTGVYNPAPDSLGFTAGGVLGLSLTEAGSHVVQTNEEHVGLTASVTQTQVGGLALLSSYNEIATVANSGDALTAFAVAIGERLVVINNGANDLQLFPAVGDDIGAGVDTAITIAVGAIGIFIGRDATNWDTLYNFAPIPVTAPGGADTAVQFNNAGVFGGSPDFEWDGSEVKVEASQAGFIADESDGGGASFFRATSTSTGDSGIQLEFDSTTGVNARIRQVTPGGSLEDIWISFAEDAGVGIRHNNIQKLLTVASGVQFDDSLYVIEKAAANADVAGQGQIWVNSVPNPNTLMYTNENGDDIDLTSSLWFNAVNKVNATALGMEVTNILTLLGGGSLQVSEKAGAAVDVPGEGQFWVRNDVPNTPMFTDDVGTDFVLNARAIDNDAVQARRTTDYLLTLAFVDITMDTTDVETDAAVLDHDLVTNTDNIIIGVTGTYKIDVNVTADPDPGAPNRRMDLSARVRLNDLGTGIPGSLSRTSYSRDATAPFDNHLSFSFIANLTAADFITLQLSKTVIGGAAGTDNANEISVNAVRLL